MKRELGIARCGLACCLCTEKADCNGCDSNGCPDNDICENKNCLERNEKNGIVYHRNGINGDYDDFDDVEQLMNFILTGVR